MGNLLLGARDDDGGGWAEAKDGNKVEDEPPLARLFGSKPLNAAPSDGVFVGDRGLSFGSGGGGGANGNTATAAAAAAAPKKEAESPKRRSRSGTGLFGAGRAPPPAPRLGTPAARIRAAVERQLAAERAAVYWRQRAARRVPIDERGARCQRGNFDPTRGGHVPGLAVQHVRR